MVTIKKRGQKLSSFLLLSSLSIVLTACGPAGPRDVIKGAKLLRAGDYPGAIAKLEEATHLLAKDPATVQAQAWNFLGLAYQNAGQAANALKAYQQALRLDRNLVEADYNMGVLHLEQGNFPAAVDSLTTYNTFRPKDVEGILKLGSAHLHWATHANSTDKIRRLDNARKCFEAAQRITPTAEGANALGVVMLQRNRPTDAQKEFNSALELDASYAPAVLNVAIIAHQYQHDHRLALEKYREYLALKPTPDNAAEIQVVVNSLEREFAPPPVAATPVPKPTVAPTPTPAITPAPVAIAPKTNPQTTSTPVAKTSSAVSTIPNPIISPAQKAVVANVSPVSSKQSTPSTSGTVASLEVAQVSDSTTPKAAQDVSVSQPGIPQPAMAPVSGPRPVALQPLEPKPEKKNGLLKKLNPVGWFGKKNKTKDATEPAPEVIKDTPLPETKPVVATAQPSVVTPLPPKPVFARYQYLSPSKPAPGNSQAAAQFISQGTVARRNAHYEDAILAYRQALVSDPANYDAAYLLGITEQEASDFPASLPFFEQAMAINPQSTDARYAFAWSLQKAKYPQDAANELEKLLAQSPNDPKGNLLLATLYAQSLNEPKLARGHYLRVLKADPHNAQATAIRFWLAANP